VLVSTLRQHFTAPLSRRGASAAVTKPYYLSAAPQCPFPDASNPMAMLKQCDFVFVQFYNNPICELGSAGFAPSVRQWSAALGKSQNTQNAGNDSTSSNDTGDRRRRGRRNASAGGSVDTRFYIGAPAFAAAGQTAYAKIGESSFFSCYRQFEGVASQAREGECWEMIADGMQE
jgi:hypothetical protein